MNHDVAPIPASRPDAGFAAIGMVIMLVPLLFTVGSFLQTMTGRGQSLQAEVREEKALMAAETGLDVAIYQARLGLLTNGAAYTEVIPGGASFSVTATNLGIDAQDNDSDGQVDEADEQVFQLVSTGSHGSSQRRVAAYMGFNSFLPTVTAAASITNPATSLVLGGASQISGLNHNTSGAVQASGHSAGLSIASPGTTANLLATMTAAEQAKVLGLTAAPSLGTSAAMDVNAMVAGASASANIVVNASQVAGASWGTNAAPKVVYRSGNLKLTGNGSGSGILVVTGDLQLVGNFTWTGVVIVLGTFDGGGTSEIRGGLVLGPSSPKLDITGTSDINFSQAGVDIARTLTGRYTVFNGWQEISTNAP